MKIKYSFIISFCLILFSSFFYCTNAFAFSADSTSVIDNNTFKTNAINDSNVIVITQRCVGDDGASYSSNDYNVYVVCSNSAINFSNPVASPITKEQSKLYTFTSDFGSWYYALGKKYFDRSGGTHQLDISASADASVFVLKGTFSIMNKSYNTGSSFGSNVLVPPTSDFDISDISKYPVGTVKIVQPKDGSKFQYGITTSIDFEVWGKIPISINDSKFSGLSENLWLTNALSAPIQNNSAIYIDGVEDRIGTGIGIGSASLGDSYGFQILGDVDQWKKAGYYCFKYKFTYSPKLAKKVDSVKFGVSPITSWTSGYLFGDDYSYTYFSDSLDIKVDTYIDNNKDGKDDLTGEDLSNLNDNSSNIGLSKNASIAETMAYYSNKFYDAITGVIKTPFNMLESALALGDTYLIKLSALLSPVTANFKQLLSFIPDDIMLCIWSIISCRLIWTAVRSFIAMLTKR